MICTYTKRKSIRIFNGCEVRIENSVTRITVRHREDCREFSIRTEQPLSWLLILFFLYILPSMTLLKFEYALFYQFCAKISTFSIKKFSVRLVMHEVVLHTSYKMEISRMDKTRGKPCRVCKKNSSAIGLHGLPVPFWSLGFKLGNEHLISNKTTAFLGT